MTTNSLLVPLFDAELNLATLIEQGESLALVPVLPLYQSLLAADPAQLAQLIPLISKEQRQHLLDLDCWAKDSVAPGESLKWMAAYAHVENERLRFEYATSDDFLMLLKGCVNFWTFDDEDPNYPEHDNYWITDDRQLLFEFAPDFDLIGEFKQLIFDLYARLGVEQAYAYLFKILNDSFELQQEQIYQLRKGRLELLGMIDYYDALALHQAYASWGQLHAFVQKSLAQKSIHLGDVKPSEQSLHSRALVELFTDQAGPLLAQELAKVKSPARLDYLRFNFFHFMNAFLVYTNGFRKSKMTRKRLGESGQSLLLLALDYLKQTTTQEVIWLDAFDYCDLYKIGRTLMDLQQRDIKKALKQSRFVAENEFFCGKVILRFLEDSFVAPVRCYQEGTGQSEIVQQWRSYQEWQTMSALMLPLLSWTHLIYEQWEKLTQESQIVDHCYLNYRVDEVDIEALLLTFFLRLHLQSDKNQNPHMNLMAIPLGEFKSLVLPDSSVSELMHTAQVEVLRQRYQIPLTSEQLMRYLKLLWEEHYAGVEWQTLNDEDFCHIGGAVLLGMSR